MITTIPESVALPGFPATPMVCIGGLKSCHWYVLLYSECCSCKDKNGFGSLIVVADVFTSTWLVSDTMEEENGNVDVIKDDVDVTVER